MPITRYGRAKEILTKLLNESGERIGVIKLKTAVRKYIGFDEKRTVIPTLKMMMEFNLIKDIGQCHFKINAKEVLQ